MPVRHVVAPGECIATIAFDHGHHPDTVWNDPANEVLRDERETGYVLMPGDVVVVPDIRVREERVATGRRHRFRLRGVPERFNVELRDVNGPRAGVAYTLEIEQQVNEGTTGADGRISVWLPLTAKVGTLRLETGEIYTFRFGHLAPVTSEDGVRARLHNLGFLRELSAPDPDLDRAVALFRQRHALPPSTSIDDDFRAALLDAHQS